MSARASRRTRPRRGRTEHVRTRRAGAATTAVSSHMHQPHLSPRGRRDGRQERRRQGGRRIIRNPQLKGDNRDRLGQRRRRGRAGNWRAGSTAARTAATNGASVEVYEKAATVGGTTAVSGGIVWIPAHPPSADGELPVKDAMDYLRAQSLGFMDDELMETLFEPARRCSISLRRIAICSSRSPRVSRITSRTARRTPRRRTITERQAVRSVAAGRMAGPDHVLSRRFQQRRHRRRDPRQDPRIGRQRVR